MIIFISIALGIIAVLFVVVFTVLMDTRKKLYELQDYVYTKCVGELRVDLLIGTVYENIDKFNVLCDHLNVRCERVPNKQKYTIKQNEDSQT
jgi:uncharacterized protein YoxC